MPKRNAARHGIIGAGYLIQLLDMYRNVPGFCLARDMATQTEQAVFSFRIKYRKWRHRLF